MACEEYFHDELRQRGLRLTPQRELILAALHEAEGPLLAEELCEAVTSAVSHHGHLRQADLSVDLSTVYRTLGLLEELQLVAGVAAADGRRRYELMGLHGAHLHLACQRCGRVEGLPPEEAQAFVQRLRTRYGFEVSVGQMVVPGLCRRCSAEAS